MRLGYDKEHVTRFDILPAYAPSSNSDFPNDFRHVFRLSPKPNSLTKEQPLKERPPNEPPLQEQPLKEPSLKERPLEERPLEERWVLWNADRHMVSLTSNLRTFCAATLLEHKAPKPGPTQKKADSKFYYIHLEMTNHHGESTELRELRLSAADLTARDLSMKTFETPEVSFARHKRGKYLFGKIPSKPGAPSKPASEREELHFNLFRLFSG